jgi:hypothetical protein
MGKAGAVLKRGDWDQLTCKLMKVTLISKDVTTMDAMLKAGLWHQYGAAIDMLDDTITLCPDELWTARVWEDTEDARYGHYWFIAYHTLAWLDKYLTGTSEGFGLPAPFLAGRLPETPYTKEEVQGYLKDCRERCQATIAALTDERAHQMTEWDLPYLELQLYNMRHVQEHASQLNYVLGEHGVQGLDWVRRARE